MCKVTLHSTVLENQDIEVPFPGIWVATDNKGATQWWASECCKPERAAMSFFPAILFCLRTALARLVANFDKKTFSSWGWYGL